MCPWPSCGWQRTCPTTAPFTTTVWRVIFGVDADPLPARHERVAVGRVFPREGGHPVRVRIELMLEEDRKVRVRHIPENHDVFHPPIVARKDFAIQWPRSGYN